MNLKNAKEVSYEDIEFTPMGALIEMGSALLSSVGTLFINLKSTVIFDKMAQTNDSIFLSFSKGMYIMLWTLFGISVLALIHSAVLFFILKFEKEDVGICKAILYITAVLMMARNNWFFIIFGGLFGGFPLFCILNAKGEDTTLYVICAIFILIGLGIFISGIVGFVRIGLSIFRDFK